MNPKEIIQKLKEALGKLNLTQKIIVGSIILAIIILFMVISVSSTSSGKYPLYGINYKISEKDLERIQKALKGMNIEFETIDNQIFVKDKELAAKARTELGLEGIIPQGIKSWELFDNQPFTTTDFERKINVRRAITASIKQHLEKLDEIESADVVISFGEEKYFKDDLNNFPLTASVVITPSPGSDITTNKKKIKGLRDLIAKGVDMLTPENIVILDNQGDVLTDKLTETDEEENIRLAKEQIKIKEKLRMHYYNELKKLLERVFTSDRFDIKLNLELNWDVVKMKENLLKPVIIKPDNPETPYDDSVVVDSLTVSKKSTKETFKGQGYIPEGPAGIEDQVPAGLKEKMDRYNVYEKQEDIENKEFSRSEQEIRKAPYDIKNMTVTVFLDGLWEKERDKEGDIIIENGKIKRKFIPVEDIIVKKVEESVKAYIGFNEGRGDKVAVSSIQFDRTKEFEKEDEEIRKAEKMRKTIMAVIIGLISLFVISIVYKAIEREMARRRRLREEELIKQQEALRFAALKAAEQESVGAELSPEERARLELQDNAIKLAKEKPEDVAKLLRTWLSEE
ncbi:MAG TPA: flagellar basal-body MS-ring/collar protein FliF [Spirochaetota bacterium]|nr:flagellar basal-body MS-ring/collar protein FliF [Spirochaetota bacterium]HOM37805.1 flagellar basal-body MS-ring/collar protein FliF [Spirochaetota bacterium]HPQ49318.1 flagellar basal-body MS-ring/collar protein FliF [Spirochaetota bacterium]